MAAMCDGGPRHRLTGWAMSPIASPEIEAVVERIRGKMRQATLFVAEGSLAVDLIQSIRAAAG